MPRWLSGWNIAIVGKVALVLLALVTVTQQESWSAERELRWVSPSKISTLGAYVSPQDSKLDATLGDSINRGIATDRKSAAKYEVATRTPSRAQSKSKSTWKTIGTARSRTASKPTPSAKNKKKPDGKTSPLGKWLTPEDFVISPKVDGALATDDSPMVSVTDAPAKKLTRSASAKKVTRSAPAKKLTPTKSRPKTAAPPKKSRAPSERLAVRVRHREIRKAPRNSPVQETMHPTEWQKDDRKRPTEPPVKNLPTPDRDVPDEASPAVVDDLPPLSKSQIRLRTKIRRVLAHYYNRPLNTGDRGPWELMHSMLSFEVNTKVLRGGPRGKPVSLVGWMCFNQPCRQRTLMYVNDGGELRVRVAPALQGHRGQLLSLLAQSKVRSDYPMRVEGHDLSVADLVDMEKRTCYPRTELSFKLIGLMHYLPSDSQWVNDEGMEWDMRRLVSEELRQPIRGAACGGTHRLVGLTLAYKEREQRGEPVDGEYLQAKRFVAKYQQYAYRMQNSDGSLSTEWFRGPGNKGDIDRKLQTTGHLLEWLLYAATEKELKNSRTMKAANYLANIMYSNRNKKKWDAGIQSHAIHALLLYDRLVFGPHNGQEDAPMASKTKRSSSRSRR